MKKNLSELPLRSGVGIVVLNNSNKVFVAKRIDNPKNFWQMPQGGIDDEEDPAAAVLRELREETGTDQADIIGETVDWLTYDLPTHLRGKVWKGRFRGQVQKWFALKLLEIKRGLYAVYTHDYKKVIIITRNLRIARGFASL